MARQLLLSIISRLATVSIAAALVLLLLAEVLGLHNSVSATWEILSSGTTTWTEVALLAGFAAGTLWVASYVGRRPSPFSPLVFLLAVVGGGLVLHVLLAVFVEPQWSTDYLRYWQHAQKLVRDGKYGGFGSAYYSRALLVPYPLIRLFGPEATFALKLANVLLLTACQLFAYDILRRSCSHKAAQAGTILLVTAPLPAYATLIPSHDLWGMFFLSGAIWVLTLGLFPTGAGRPRARRWITLALLAGCIAYLSELQRSTGAILCVAVLFASVVSWLVAWSGSVVRPGVAHRLTITVMAALLCFGSMAVTKKVGDERGLGFGLGNSLFMMKVAANSGGMGSGTSDWFVRFNNRFGSKQASEMEATDFAKSMALSSWSLQPLERIAHLADQSRRLFELNYPMDWDVMLRRPKGMSAHAREAFILYADLYGIMFGILLVYALARLAASRRPPPFPVLALLFSVLLLAFTLLMLFENKPFNIFPVWFAASLAIAHVFAHGDAGVRANTADEDGAGPGALPPMSWRPLAEGLALVVAVVLATVATIRGSYGVADGRLINDWTFHGRQAVPVRGDGWKRALLDARPEAFDPASYDPRTIKKTLINHSIHDGDRIQKYAGDTFVRLQFPGTVTQGDQLDMETRVCNSTGKRKSVEYFLFSPKPRKAIGDFALSVSIDGRQVQHSALPLDSGNFHRFVLRDVLPDRACHTLGFRLEALRLGNATRASRTPFAEVWMPRLIP